MKNNLVSLNIINTTNNTLLNKTQYPILFYWDGEGELVESLKTQNNFIDYVYDVCLNINNYSDSSIKMFHYAYNDNDEDIYNEYDVSVQDLIPLSSLTDIYISFVYTYIYLIFKGLYNQSLKKDFEDNDDMSLIDKIKLMYNTIQNKFSARFVKSTVTKYVMSQLDETYHLNKNNIEYLMDEFSKNILKDIQE